MRGMGHGAWAMGGALLLGLALAACAVESDGVSTAGAFDDGGVSTAGTFDDGAPPRPPSEARDDPAELLAALDRDFSPAQTLGYDRARDVLYAHEQAVHGAVCGLYSDFCVRLSRGDPSAEAFRLGINAEHVWPQSMGARAEPLRSDLHHLFPEREQVNSSRGNLPFGEISDARADAWVRGDASQSAPPRTGIDAWSERGEGRFEPRETKKGDVARAVFYAVTMYPELVEPAFFNAMREDLLDWNRLDPPDADERARSAWVATLQGTENPFVLDPGLADRLWAVGGLTVTTPAPPPSTSASVWINEIHYDNDGEDVGEGVEVAGTGSLDGWRLVFVNGTDRATYREVPLAGALDGATWVPVTGIQNGSPDGVALVDPSGRVVEALAWEGTFTGVGGRIDGVTFRDLGASETPETPPGRSLQRIGGPAGARWVLQEASPGRINAGQTLR